MNKSLDPMAEAQIRQLAIRQFVQFSVMAFVLFVFVDWRTLAFSLLALTTIGLLLGVACPGVASPVFEVYRKVGDFFRRVVSTIVLTIVFFGVVLPLGILLKLLGKDSLQSKLIDNNQAIGTIVNPNQNPTSIFDSIDASWIVNQKPISRWRLTNPAKSLPVWRDNLKSVC